MSSDSSSGASAITDLNIIVLDTPDEVANRAADAVSETLAANPAATVSLPTGSTPVKTYREILRRVAAGELDISKMNLFLLDEYLGQTQTDETSLTHMFAEEFLTPGNLGEHVHYIPSADPDPDAAAARYEDELASYGGLDLAILGLGPNGHIAFNEPGSAADSRTRVIDLTPESRNQSSNYFEGQPEIPAQAMTMGVGTLLEAKRIVLIVTGSNKAEMLRRTLEEPMSADVPASWLRRAGDRLEVVVDRPAASKLEHLAG